MDRNYSVYMHKNKTNEKVYIGITGRKSEKRWLNGHGYKNNIHFNKVIQKYGWDNAAEKTNTQLSHISNCCNKIRPRAETSDNGEGLFWMFYDEYISKNYDSKTNNEIIPKFKIVCKKRPIKCVETGIIYDSVSEAHRKTNILKSSLSMCLNGKSKTAGKYHWIFADCEDI